MYTFRFIENMFVILVGIIVTNIYLYFSPVQVLFNIYYLRNKQYGYRMLLNMKLPIKENKIVPNGTILSFMFYNKDSFWKHYFIKGNSCNTKICLEKIKVNIFKNVYILNIIGKDKDWKNSTGYYLNCFEFLFKDILDKEELNKHFSKAEKIDIKAYDEDYTVVYFNSKKDAEEALESLDSYLVLKRFSE